MWICEFKIPKQFLLLYKVSSLFSRQNIQIKPPGIKQYMQEIFKNTLDGIIRKLDISEKKIGEFKDIAIERIKKI